MNYLGSVIVPCLHILFAMIMISPLAPGLLPQASIPTWRALSQPEQSSPKTVKRKRIRLPPDRLAMDDRQTSKIRSRRSHHKSRLGCRNCKKRRVKCDEKKPTCTNCLHHSVECDFSAPPVLPSEGSPASFDSSISTRRFRFKQSKYQQVTESSPTDENLNLSLDSTSTGVQCDLSASHHGSGGISFADLELFHQFITTTYCSFGDVSTKHRSIWQMYVPRCGITFPSIHHLILAIAALHLAYEHPDRRVEYVMRADSHFTFGVRSVTNILSKMDSNDCQIIYLSAVLICFIYFARGPRRGEYLVFSETGQSEWLVLMRGVRFILNTKRSEVFTGILDPGEQEQPMMTVALEAEFLEQRTHLDAALRFLSENVPETENDLYVSAMEKLIGSFQELHNIRSIRDDGAALMPAAIGWIYRLPETFVERLEDKDSYALVILAHWSVMLKYMTPSWFMEGWDVHVLSGIRSSLRVDYHQWIKWPVRMISGA